MAENVENLADYSFNAAHWSVEQMLVDALRAIREGDQLADKAIVIFLDKGEARDEYNVHWVQAQLKNSEIVSLLDVAKYRALTELIEGA